ncbi:MAG TPA: aminoglycoside phosphotransferase family protein [Streptosporangiaceae bacterium]|jgi:aminoglycoside phosphotransferase (APT) family kinase protein
MKMHDGEADIGAGLVRRLVASQFPALAGLPVTAFRSTGTVNAIFRLGDGLYARLPRMARWARDLEQEARWLPRLAGRLPLAIPEPVALGRPGAGYPFGWAIFRWIEGQPYAGELVEERQAARDLARFVTVLRQVDTADAPRAGRRPLRELDAGTRAGIEDAGDDIDHDAVLAAWELALQAPAWDGMARAWIHADLLPPNLLVSEGCLRAVIDWGAAGAGDPAMDLIAAWSVFGPAGREVFRDALGAGDWDRARGVALHQAVMLIPYYRVTNPGMAALGRRTVGQVLADIRARG